MGFYRNLHYVGLFITDSSENRLYGAWRAIFAACPVCHIFPRHLRHLLADHLAWFFTIIIYWKDGCGLDGSKIIQTTSPTQESAVRENNRQGSNLNSSFFLQGR